MGDSSVFERTCADLEQATSLDTLSARGTVRLVLKSAGLDAREVTAAQMIVVAKKVLPAELKARGVQNVDEVCAAIAAKLSHVESTEVAKTDSSIEEVFRRLGGA
jgi:hypothetical protein